MAYAEYCARVPSCGRVSSSFSGGIVPKDRDVSAEMARNDDHRGEDRGVDEHVLDDRDERRRAEAGVVGVRREDDERDDERQVATTPVIGQPQSRQHDLDADQLQRDVRHRRENAGERDRERQGSAAEAPHHEVRRRDVPVLVRDRPEPRERHVHEGIDQERVRDREETDRARAVHERGYGDERVRRVQIAAEQEPRDDRAEAPAAKAPFIEPIEIARGASAPRQIRAR